MCEKLILLDEEMCYTWFIMYQTICIMRKISFLIQINRNLSIILQFNRIDEWEYISIFKVCFKGEMKFFSTFLQFQNIDKGCFSCFNRQQKYCDIVYLATLMRRCAYSVCVVARDTIQKHKKYKDASLWFVGTNHKKLLSGKNKKIQHDRLFIKNRRHL